MIGKKYIRDNEELKYALEVIKKLEDAGHEALIVGGFVRDLIMGKLTVTKNLIKNEKSLSK